MWTRTARSESFLRRKDMNPEYRRLMGALGRRGFSGEAIRRVMESMREEYDSFL